MLLRLGGASFKFLDFLTQWRDVVSQKEEETMGGGDSRGVLVYLAGKQ